MDLARGRGIHIPGTAYRFTINHSPSALPSSAAYLIPFLDQVLGQGTAVTLIFKEHRHVPLSV